MVEMDERIHGDEMRWMPSRSARKWICIVVASAKERTEEPDAVKRGVDSALGTVSWFLTIHLTVDDTVSMSSIRTPVCPSERPKLNNGDRCGECRKATCLKR